MHLEFLVEGQADEEALKNLLPLILQSRATFKVHSFNGKPALLRKLPDRFRGYRLWLPHDWKVVVLVDQDSENCTTLKSRIGQMAEIAGLKTRGRLLHYSECEVLSRIAVEELEAWFFGDATAIIKAYPKMSSGALAGSRYRNPDAIQGGTWEHLEKLLRKAGYMRGGLRKISSSREISSRMDVENNTSRSFQVFRDGIRAMI